MMDRRDVQAFLKGVSTVVREQLAHVSQALIRLEARIEAVAAVQPLKGEPGESIRGDAGASAYDIARSAGFTGTIEEWLSSLKGKDAPAVDVDSIVLRAAELVPKPEVPFIEWIERNHNGIREAILGVIPPVKQPELIDEEKIILRVLERIPTPEPGKSVDPEEVRQMVAAEAQRAVAALPPPPAGKDADMGTLAHWVTEAVSRAAETLTTDLTQKVIAEIKVEVAKIPKPKDGVSPDPIHPDTIALQIREAVDRAISAIPKPEPSRPGRDALQIDVLPSIDPGKSYPRDTYAEHDGGMIRSIRQTTPGETLNISEWSVVMNGWPERGEELSGDCRTLTIWSRRTLGQRQTKTYRMRHPEYCEVWKLGETYHRGQMVTFHNSVWCCLAESTQHQPGTAPTDWILAVRAGRDGRDFRDIEPKKNGSVHFK